METTRHFTATTYVVHEGAVALHFHDRLEKWLPPGGHVERDELPHVAARREVAEELGIDVDLVAEWDDVASETVEPLPKPRHVQLADVNVTEQGVGHQHVDLVYYAVAPHRDVNPDDGERRADAWEWFTADELAAERDGQFDPDVVDIGRRAIEKVDSEE